MIYLVVASDTLAGLVDAVNAKMREGWVAAGGVSAYTVDVVGAFGSKPIVLTFMQALTKEG